MKKHIIFDNYNVTENYDLAIENLIENGYYSTAEEIPEAEIWEEVADMEHIWFDDERTMMEEFFSGKTLLVCGSVGRWNGRFAAGKVIEYDDLWKCWSDCDYISIYDEGGHFYIKASHHDGTNIYEVKVLTEKVQSCILIGIMAGAVHAGINSDCQNKKYMNDSGKMPNTHIYRTMRVKYSAAKHDKEAEI